MPILDITPQEIRFRTGKAWLDVAEFEALLQACLQHNHPAPWDCPACLQRLERLDSLYAGEFLQGFDLPDCLAFEDWLRLQRETYRMKMIRAVGWLSQGGEAAGELEKALGFAKRWVVLDPLDEAAHRRVMQVLNHLGRRSDALAQYALCQRILADELGVEPDEETAALYQQIRMPSGGERFAEGSLSNLPARLTPLVGRQAELVRLPHQLLDPACRLVTLLGPGGVGKTSLALELGTAVSANFPDGVCLIEFDLQQSSRSLLQALALAVGLGQSPGSEGGLARPRLDLEEQICAFLKPRRLLLILDGFEGMVHEAHLVGKLLRELPLLKILVTSRLRLNLASEQIFLVQGLSFPPESAFEKLDSYNAVQLFVVAARRSDPNFELNPLNQASVLAICRLVQGVPLGILLAAAWVNILPVEKIVKEIQNSLDFLAVDWTDLPDRQRSLRATFDHSWRLLSQTGRSVFMRLSVINGPFTIERAFQVAEASLEDLKNLVEQSLLQRVEAERFRIHNLLRQYAQEKLAALPAENSEVHMRYCRVYLEALAAWEWKLKSAQQFEVLLDIDQEFADFLAAWEWGMAVEAYELCERAVETLFYYHSLRGLFMEGAELCQRARQNLERHALSAENLRLWVQLGNWQIELYDHLGEPEEARRVIAQVDARMAEWSQLAGGMYREQAILNLNKGNLILWNRGNNVSALEHFQKALAHMRIGENAWDISLALHKVAVGYDQMGDRFQSGEAAEKAMQIQHTLGDPYMILAISATLGYFYMITGDYEKGLQIAEERSLLQRRFNTRRSENFAKLYMAHALLYAGQFGEAKRRYQELIADLSYPNESPIRLLCCFTLAIIDLHTGNYLNLLIDSTFSEEPLTDYYRDALGLFKGQVYLLSADWERAEIEFRQYMDQSLSLGNIDDVGQPLALLGYIAYRRGDRDSALDLQAQALANGVQYGAFGVLMLALSGLALMLAEAGELEQAVEVYAAVTTHPFAANSRWLNDMFGQPLSALCAALPAEKMAAAQERGRGQKLRQVGEKFFPKVSPGR